MNPEITLQFKPLDKISAHIAWDGINPPSRVRIQVDNDKEGRIKCVVHELLHVVFYDLFDNVVDEMLEEWAHRK